MFKADENNFSVLLFEHVMQRRNNIFKNDSVRINPVVKRITNRLLVLEYLIR